MKPQFLTSLTAAALFALSNPWTAHAQTMSYGDLGGGAPAASSDGGSDQGDEASDDGDGGTVLPGIVHRTGRVRITPYIEAQQVVTAELSPGNEVLTYSTLAAGVEANVSGRRGEAGLAVRYERRFGWGSNKISDSDVVSGVARASVAVVPHALFIEGGAMAARMSVENNGAGTPGLEFGNSSARIYAAYVGPSLKTQLGAIDVEGHYRFGISKVSSPNVLAAVPGQTPIDLYDRGTVHNAVLHFGTKAGTVLPIGLGVGGGWNREDTSNLDQRIDDKHVRADALLPVGGDLALVGGVGYEKVQVSQRNAVIDPISGLPVLRSSGRYVTDTSQPRQIAYESEGLIWDAGVMWRPSRRTALEAHVGRRYGSTTYFGSFAYAPNSRTTLNVSVYDGISGFGGRLNQALADLPTQFDGLRNPLTGGLSTCVAGTTTDQGNSGGGCLNGALGSVRSASFRGRGVMASLGIQGNSLQYGLGAGYDRHTFIAAPGTVLALANGVIDENYWVAAYLNGRIDRNSSFGTNVWANWYHSGDALAGDSSSIGATAAYYRTLTGNLTATAAVGINGVNRDALQDIWTASGLVGLRYSF